jgi:uncharacterized protein YgbK (DUF1537 family)
VTTRSHPHGGTVVLDDDPTGAQASVNVTVILDPDPSFLSTWTTDRRPGTVFVSTNTRAMSGTKATALAAKIVEAVRGNWPTARFVMRGDSTLRGHVLEEYLGVVGAARPTLVLLPALPRAGRITKGGVHYIERDGRFVRLDQTEYASDADFAYTSSNLGRWAEERSSGLFSRDRTVVLEVAELRRRGAAALTDALRRAGDMKPPAVCVIDAEREDDLRLAADALEQAQAIGMRPAIRCGPDLAALLGRCHAERLVAVPRASRVLVAGSYVSTTTRQLRRLDERFPDSVAEVDPVRLLSEPGAELRRLQAEVERFWSKSAVATIATPRQAPAAGVLAGDLGRRVAEGMANLVRRLRTSADLVVAKGGITAAVIAAHAFGASTAWVEGPVRAGVSLWSLPSDDHEQASLVVFPGNVGGNEVLADLVEEATGA